MSKTYEYLTLNLQLFGDGAGAAAGGTSAGEGTAESGIASAPKGVKNPLADVQYGKQEGDVQTTDAPQVADDRASRFEEMIKGEYKDLYDQRVQDTIQKRLKSSKETVERYNALAPTLDTLSRKYGVDASDIEALNKAIEEDDTYFEEEALEKGITVEQLKEIRRMERENAQLKAQMRDADVQANADRIYADWMEQSESVKQVYPQFDLETELENPRFTDLIRNNIDIRTAYEVLHKDEIIPAAMQFTAQQVERKLANKIRSGQGRPQENGMSNAAAAVVKSDVSQLSKADRAEIARRVARGERIVF